MLLAVALIGLFALVGLTNGAWISPIAHGLMQILGWGSIFLIVGVALLGFFALRNRSPDRPAVHLVQVLALEGAAFCIIIIFSIASGSEILKAQAGMDYGGWIGWGLAELLLLLVGPGLRIVFTVIALILFLGVGAGLPGLLARWIDHKIENAASLTEGIVSNTFPIFEKDSPGKNLKEDLPEKKKFLVLRSRDERLPP